MSLLEPPACCKKTISLFLLPDFPQLGALHDSTLNAEFKDFGRRNCWLLSRSWFVSTNIATLVMPDLPLIHQIKKGDSHPPKISFKNPLWRVCRILNGNISVPHSNNILPPTLNVLMAFCAIVQCNRAVQSSVSFGFALQVLQVWVLVQWKRGFMTPQGPLKSQWQRREGGH